eukprot:305173-Chlamydomonas_euryale.AAC.3
MEANAVHGASLPLRNRPRAFLKIGCGGAPRRRGRRVASSRRCGCQRAVFFGADARTACFLAARSAAKEGSARMPTCARSPAVRTPRRAASPRRRRLPRCAHCPLRCTVLGRTR